MQVEQEQIRAALLESELEAKLAAVQALPAAVATEGWVASPTPALPGRPARLRLVAPREVPRRRNLASREGRFALLHALAHIEFNAINLALDAVCAFAGLPEAYYADWLQVAKEEAAHFAALRALLQEMGGDYGDLPAHNGLWEMACETADDPLKRMALVPRVLEARGLDATPGIRARLQAVGDTQADAVLAVIEREEVGHVAAGSHWFRWLCAARGLDAEAQFFLLLDRYYRGQPGGDFAVAARLAAGFSEWELQTLRARAAEGRAHG
ncbi:ferritin-like domain-containing protein [Acidithiobacillus sp. AMEEHan]|uniref:ferritin-like domain-containing protein n=1 Tax=Acidithiobacillus sp. AMEEHan TaxID=2994951 RepID=UPI0027E4F54F|nr:ferritin-like domain-containing protein [Acidithiobacillus sp. AMEEHan]